MGDLIWLYLRRIESGLVLLLQNDNPGALIKRDRGSSLTRSSCRLYSSIPGEVVGTESEGSVSCQIFDFTLNDIRPTYDFDGSCAGTVPPAIVAFLESTNFEGVIRNAISIGGDSDTLAAITGSIAGAFYGVPETILTKALTYLTEGLGDVVRQFSAETIRVNSD